MRGFVTIMKKLIYVFATLVILITFVPKGDVYASHKAKSKPAAKKIVKKFGCYPPKSFKCQRPPASVYQEVRRTLNQNGFGYTWSVAKEIIACESGWNPNAKNSSGAKGLWQLLGHDDLFINGMNWANPADNTKVAMSLMRGETVRGNPWWWDWRFSKGCWG